MKIISNNTKISASRKAIPKTGHRLLSTAGKRVTSQRLLLFELIRSSEGHLDAEALYIRAKENNPRISLSTVYRTLQLFKKLGLVDEHHFGETHHHYEVKDHNEHHHLVCLSCGEIIEFQSSLTIQMKKDVADKNNFHIIDTEVRMVGLCSGCQSKQ